MMKTQVIGIEESQMKKAIIKFFLYLIIFFMCIFALAHCLPQVVEAKELKQTSCQWVYVGTTVVNGQPHAVYTYNCYTNVQKYYPQYSPQQNQPATQYPARRWGYRRY
jgi:hypothetical protein